MQTAFRYEDLVSQHGAAVRARAMELTGNRSTAEDVVQETLLRAWRNREVLATKVGSVRGWLLTVAHNVAIDVIRSRRAYPFPAGDAAWESLQKPVLDHADAVVDTAVLFPALRRLTAEHRDVLFELYFRRSSVAEAAESIGIPQGTVKSRAYYAVRALRTSLIEKG